MAGENKFDVRNVERNIMSKKLSKEEYANYLEGLEDCSDLMEECETQFMNRAKADLEKEEAQAEE